MTGLSSVMDDMDVDNWGSYFVYSLVLNYCCLCLIERSNWSFYHILVTIVQCCYSDVVD